MAAAVPSIERAARAVKSNAVFDFLKNQNTC
jgi:hypothetical protein